MTELAGDQTIEVVRGRMDDELAERVLAFWSESGALEGEAARERLAELVCVLRGEEGEVLGVNSVHEEPVRLIGSRPFFVYRAFLSPEAGARDAMFQAAFDVLDQAHESDRSGPVGICVVVSDPEDIRRRPEAVWEGTDLLYAGTDPDGRQLRVRYFHDATIAPGYPNSPSIAESEAADYSLGPGYRIVPLAEADGVGPDDVVALWARESVVFGQEAERRVSEVLMVALDPDGRLAGLTTAYLQPNRQLGMDVWYLRGFVSSDNRLANLAVRMLWASRDHLSERFVSGEDPRAPGIVMIIQNEGLMQYFNRAYWVYSDFYFIGEGEAGAHVRVHYFPGAKVPEVEG